MTDVATQERKQRRAEHNIAVAEEKAEQVLQETLGLDTKEMQAMARAAERARVAYAAQRLAEVHELSLSSARVLAVVTLKYSGAPVGISTAAFCNLTERTRTVVQKCINDLIEKRLIRRYDMPKPEAHRFEVAL